MNADSILPTRPDLVAWTRRFTRPSWVGASSPREKAKERGGASRRGKVIMGEDRIVQPQATTILTASGAAGGARPRLSHTTKAQLAVRLRSLYACDQSPMPDAMQDLLARLDIGKAHK